MALWGFCRERSKALAVQTLVMVIWFLGAVAPCTFLGERGIVDLVSYAVRRALVCRGTRARPVAALCLDADKSCGCYFCSSSPMRMEVAKLGARRLCSLPWFDPILLPSMEQLGCSDPA